MLEKVFTESQGSFLLDSRDLLKPRKHWTDFWWIALIGPVYAIFMDLQQTCERWESCDFREQSWKNNWRLGFQVKPSPLTTPASCNPLIRQFLKYNKHPKRLSKEEKRKESSVSHWCEKEERTPTVWKRVPDEVCSFDKNYALWPDRWPQNKNQAMQIRERQYNRYML